MEKSKLPQISLIIFIFFFLFYTSRVLPSVFGADSGELLAVMKVLGVAHPPGYPLYTILGHIFLQLPFGEPAFRVGLLSSLASSFTLVFLFLSAYLLTRSNISSLLAVLILGFSYTFSLYSEVVEVFALNNLFASILIFCSIYILIGKSVNVKTIYIMAFVFGLSLVHHHTILSLTPCFIYLYYKKRKLFSSKVIFKTLVVFFLGLLPYIYLPLAARQLPALNWGNPSTLSNFLAVIFRANYGTFLSVAGNVPQMSARLIQIPAYMLFLFLDFSFIGIIVSFLGSFSLFKKERSPFIFLLLGFLFSGPLFFFYAAFPLNQNYIVGILERFFILSTLFFALFLSYGINTSFSLFYKVVSRLHFKHQVLRFSSSVLTCFYLLFTFILFNQNLNRLDLRDVWLGNDYAYDLLRPVEKNSIVLLSGDMALFSAQYVYYDLGYRPDIKLIPLSRIREFYVIQKLQKLYPDLALPKKPDDVSDIALDIIKNNQNKFNIYSMNPLPIGKWYLEGFLYRYVSDGKDLSDTDIKNHIITALDGLYDVHKVPQKLNNTIFFSEIKEAYYSTYLANIAFLQSRGSWEESKKYLDYVAASPSLSTDTEKLLDKNYAVYYFNKKSCIEAEKYALSSIGLTKENSEEATIVYGFLETIARDCFHSNTKLKYYQSLISPSPHVSDIPLEKL